MDEARHIAESLLAAKKTVATAESCTGGLLGKLLTDISGSSKVYPGGVISYSSEVKYRVLGVEQALLDANGPVCPQVARQMAEGVRRVMGADFGISTTGIAGPGGDGSGKPVGLVYVAVAGAEETRVLALRLSGSRENVREGAARAVLTALARMLS